MNRRGFLGNIGKAVVVAGLAQVVPMAAQSEPPSLAGDLVIGQDGTGQWVRAEVSGLPDFAESLAQYLERLQAAVDKVTPALQEMVDTWPSPHDAARLEQEAERMLYEAMGPADA